MSTGARALDEIAGRDPFPAAEEGVDLEHALGDGPGRRDGGDGVAALGIVHVQPRVGMAVGLPPVRMGPAQRVRPGPPLHVDTRPILFMRSMTGAVTDLLSSPSGASPAGTSGSTPLRRKAELINDTWEKAWGKFPTMRPA